MHLATPDTEKPQSRESLILFQMPKSSEVIYYVILSIYHPWENYIPYFADYETNILKTVTKSKKMSGSASS